jgi:hypothetical protein
MGLETLPRNTIRLVEAPPFKEWEEEEYKAFCPSSQPDIDDELDRREVMLHPVLLLTNRTHTASPSMIFILHAHVW